MISAASLAIYGRQYRRLSCRAGRMLGTLGFLQRRGDFPGFARQGPAAPAQGAAPESGRRRRAADRQSRTTSQHPAHRQQPREYGRLGGGNRARHRVHAGASGVGRHGGGHRHPAVVRGDHAEGARGELCRTGRPRRGPAPRSHRARRHPSDQGSFPAPPGTPLAPRGDEAGVGGDDFRGHQDDGDARAGGREHRQGRAGDDPQRRRIRRPERRPAHGLADRYSQPGPGSAAGGGDRPGDRERPLAHTGLSRVEGPHRRRAPGARLPGGLAPRGGGGHRAFRAPPLFHPRVDAREHALSRVPRAQTSAWRSWSTSTAARRAS